MLTIALATILTILCAYIYSKYHEQLKFSATLPGAPTLPFIGTGLIFINKTPPQIFEVIRGLVKTYGCFQKIWFGPWMLALVTSPRIAETILSSQKLIDKSQEYDYIQPWLADGLLLSTGSKWFKRRKIITPTFHFKILEQFTEVFDKQGDIMVKKLREFKSSDDIDIYPLTTLYALDVISGEWSGNKSFVRAFNF